MHFCNHGLYLRRALEKRRSSAKANLDLIQSPDTSLDPNKLDSRSGWLPKFNEVLNVQRSIPDKMLRKIRVLFSEYAYDPIWPQLWKNAHLSVLKNSSTRNTYAEASASPVGCFFAAKCRRRSTLPYFGCFSSFDISQGISVATHLRCGGIFSDDGIIANFLLILTVK